jgi:hypothetical protein
MINFIEFGKIASYPVDNLDIVHYLYIVLL